VSSENPPDFELDYRQKVYTIEKIITDQLGNPRIGLGDIGAIELIP